MERSLLKLRQCEERFAFDTRKRNEHGVICGIDEAGRGPWAGRVYAAAVILDDDIFIEGLNDSKKLTEIQREHFYTEITDRALAYSVAWASVEEIEKLNILQATFLAMQRAYSSLGITADLALVDGNRLPQLPCKTETIVKGDSISASISAAGILAKVSRDRYIAELDREYPQYGFLSHKGYGTAGHIAALQKYGITPEHRRSFLKKQEAKLGKFPEYKEETL